MSKKTLIRAVADFETTTDLNDCRVWLWGYVTLNGKFTHGAGIDSFIDHVSTVKQTCYFHNLKFDGSFILDYLLDSPTFMLAMKTNYESARALGEPNPSSFSQELNDESLEEALGMLEDVEKHINPRGGRL